MTILHRPRHDVKRRVSSSIPLFVAGRPKPVAFVDPRTKTLYKTVSEKHLLTRPRAIAFDVSVLHDAVEAGAVVIRVTHAETGRVLTTTIDTFRTVGFKVNRGFGLQWALALDAWSVDGAQPERERLAEIAAAKVAAADVQQLGLFGGAV